MMFIKTSHTGEEDPNQGRGMEVRGGDSHKQITEGESPATCVQ